jgi:eukaryotic-like serine/threonine-protein kinase
LPVRARPLSLFLRSLRGAKRHPLLVTLLFLAAFLPLAGFVAWRFQESANQQARVEALIVKLLETEGGDVVRAMEELHREGAPAEARLREVFRLSAQGSLPHLRAALALADCGTDSSDSDSVSYVLQRADSADPRDLSLICTALRKHKADLVGKLWAKAQSREAEPEQCFRALCMLAELDPESRRWAPVAAPATAWLLKKPRPELYRWAELLRPVAGSMREPMVVLYRDRAGLPLAHAAAMVLAEYHSADVGSLVEFLLEADTDQFHILLPKLQDRQAAGVALLRRQADILARETPSENDAELWAKRRAIVAAALIRLGGEAGWDLLRWEPGQAPGPRTYLSHLLAPLGVKPLLVVEQLTRQKTDASRRALLLALGDYNETQIPKDQKNKLIALVRTLFITDPDPGVHSASQWVLQRWGCSGSDLAQLVGRIDQRNHGRLGWYVAPQGHTMSLILDPHPTMIGSPPSETNRQPNEPWVQYCPRPFAIAVAETSVAQFRSFQTPDKTAACDDCPVTGVNYYDAMRYCNWLSEKARMPREEFCYEEVNAGTSGIRPFPDYLNRTGYRLPTEHEWEYACRGGTLTPRFFGTSDVMLGSYSWYRDNAEGQVKPVALLRPNDLGLFDMLGNAMEWCSNTIDPPDPGLQPQVLRGSAFSLSSSSVRAAIRFTFIASNYESRAGFRIAQTLRILK